MTFPLPQVSLEDGAVVVSHSSPPIPRIVQPDATSNAPLDDAFALTDLAAVQLRARGTVAVTTGQQPGLFGGPAFTIHKALAAAALAECLGAEWGATVVPVFWAAGDDHDFAEASVATWQGSDGALHDFRLPPRDATAPQRSMARQLAGPAVRAGIDQLAATLPAGAHRDETIALIEHHYAPELPLQAAFVGMMRELLARFGVAVLDATASSLKRAQVPVLRSALEQSEAIDAALAALGNVGTGIEAGNGATLVFYEDERGRDRLIRTGSEFQLRRGQTKFSMSELDQLLDSHPELFSANVLLRPVVERALFATAAYVAGPGEFRYLTSQAPVVFSALHIPQPIAVSRWTGSVLDATHQRLLRRTGFNAEQVRSDDGMLANGLARSEIGEDASRVIEHFSDAVSDAFGMLASAGEEIDPVLERALATRQARAERLVEDLEHLFMRHVRKRAETRTAQFVRVRNALLPRGAPQERVLSVPSLLARHGVEWLDAVHAATRTWASR